ncbi:MAG: MmcQ/YjbR family DNA-binding protein [Muribaculaceae bacterium]|nr:MmcQ/YjbR family DNA-binding protein [Muribaculaceae bacterium]
MDIEVIREFCVGLEGVEETFPFDDVTLVFKVGGKMFLLLPLDVPNKICMKCDPDYSLELRERYLGIEPAFHFNKKHWNQLFLDRDVPESLIIALIEHSYQLVVSKLPKAVRATLLR